jgi:hypothetical protein
MHQYHEAVANRLLASGICPTIESAKKRVQNVFLQAEQDADVLKKSVSFGTTLLFNTVEDEEEPVYRTSLERFLKLCKAAWFRDVYSAFKACQIRGSFAHNSLGIDCACLIDPITVQGFRKKPAENKVGIFIGRSAENIDRMLRFASDVAKALACEPAWLRWGDAGAFPSLASVFKFRAVRSLDAFSYESNGRVENALSDLLTYRAIITDTYHVCVNAWNLGIPAICLAENKYSPTRNVNFGNYFARRDKRHIFLSMYDALDFLVFTDELENKALRSARVSHLARIVSSGKVVNAIQKRIRVHAESAEELLMQALSSLL